MFVSFKTPRCFGDSCTYGCSTLSLNLKLYINKLKLFLNSLLLTTWCQLFQRWQRSSNLYVFFFQIFLGYSTVQTAESPTSGSRLCTITSGGSAGKSPSSNANSVHIKENKKYILPCISWRNTRNAKMSLQSCWNENTNVFLLFIVKYYFVVNYLQYYLTCISKHCNMRTWFVNLWLLVVLFECPAHNLGIFILNIYLYI